MLLIELKPINLNSGQQPTAAVTNKPIPTAKAITPMVELKPALNTPKDASNRPAIRRIVLSTEPTFLIGPILFPKQVIDKEYTMF